MHQVLNTSNTSVDFLALPQTREKVIKQPSKLSYVVATASKTMSHAIATRSVCTTKVKRQISSSTSTAKKVDEQRRVILKAPLPKKMPRQIDVQRQDKSQKAHAANCKRINFGLVRAQHYQKILKICDQNIDHFDHVNIATACHRLAKCYRYTAIVQKKQLLDEICDTLQKLALLAIKQLVKFAPQNLANTAWAFATLNFSRPTLFNAIADQVSERIVEFNAQELANTAWAFATLNSSHPTLFNAIADQAIKRMVEFNAQELANTAWAFAKLNSPHPALFNAIAGHAIGRIAEFNPQNLANTAWAFAVMQHYSEKWVSLFIPHFKQIEKVEDLTQIAQFKLALELEDKALYATTDKLWHPSLLQCLKNWHVTASIPPESSRLHERVFEVCREIDRDCQKEYLLFPYYLDIAFVTQKIAIEVNGPSHYAQGSKQLLGHTILKTRLLQKMEWQVVHLPYWAINACQSKKALRAYVKREIEIVQHKQK